MDQELNQRDPRVGLVARHLNEGFPTIDLYARYIHEINRIWWYTPEGVKLERCMGEMYMLMASEVAEGLEGYRKNLMDDKLTQFPMLIVELADTFIRIADYVGAYEIELHNVRLVNAIQNPQTVGAKLFNINAELVLASLQPRHLQGCNLSAAIQRCLDLALEFGYELPDVIFEKIAYNLKRSDHSYEARQGAFGKKF